MLDIPTPPVALADDEPETVTIAPTTKPLAPGQTFRGDRVHETPAITAPYKHAALAAKLAKEAKAEAQRQRDFHYANLFRKPRRD